VPARAAASPAGVEQKTVVPEIGVDDWESVMQEAGDAPVLVDFYAGVGERSALACAKPRRRTSDANSLLYVYLCSLADAAQLASSETHATRGSASPITEQSG
jgi:hypothetical protein